MCAKSMKIKTTKTLCDYLNATKGRYRAADCVYSVHRVEYAPSVYPFFSQEALNTDKDFCYQTFKYYKFVVEYTPECYAIPRDIKMLNFNKSLIKDIDDFCECFFKNVEI